MSTTDIHYEAPIACMPWCSDGDGHPKEISYHDQTCDNGGDYLFLPLNARYKGKEESYAQIGVGAHRNVGFLPCIYVHLTLMDPDIDSCVQVTAPEARWLAARLLETAELIEGTEAGTGSPLSASASE